MDELEKLLDRLTIKFPAPIKLKEVERNFFEYLRLNVPCDIAYELTIYGRMYADKSLSNERYPIKLALNINRLANSVRMLSSNFQLITNNRGSIYGLKLDEMVPGYDSIEEFETLPLGSEQLRLVDDLRKRIEDYFSQRPK